MGQTSSSPMASAATHGQAFTQTEYTRQVMDQLLNYMIKQLSIRDLLQMSKESECKKYILFKANSIYQYFYELRIFPTKDARGLLTFRKVDDLVNPKGEQEKERQSLCLIVAYFYTRIFQIYGALALTLIDDMNAMTSSGIMSVPSSSDARLLTPGYYAQQAYYGKGGAGEELLSPVRPRYEERDRRAPRDAKEDLKNFVWIDSFLTSEYTSSLGYKTRYTGSSSNRGDVYLKIEDVLKDVDDRVISSYGPPPVQSKQSGTFYIGISAMNKYATLEVYTRKSTDEIKVKMNKLQFINQYGETIVTDNFEKTFYVEPKIVDGKTTYTVKDRAGTNVAIYLANYFAEITQYLRDAIKVHKNESLGSRTSSASTRRSEEGITDHLKVEKMIDDLTTRKPLGHCIARALQLLKTEPFPNQPGISQICSATFAENKRMGVVKPDEPLSKSPGLFALANLFYDTIIIGSPNLTIGKAKVDGKSSFDQYVSFMDKLSKQYEAREQSHTPEEYEEKGLDSITDTRDKAACSKTGDITLSLDATKKVHAVVKTMFQAQVTHAAACFKIVSMLFNITYDKTTKKPVLIKLSDNLITKGFPELERINRAARELLVNYYTNCEAKYWTGMKIVLDEQKAAKAAVNKKVQAEAAKKAEEDAAEAAKKAEEVAVEAAAKKTAAEEQVAKLKRRTEELRAAHQATNDARQALAAERRAQEVLRKEQRSIIKLKALEQRVKMQEEQEARVKQAQEAAAATLQQAVSLEAEKKARLAQLKEENAQRERERQQRTIVKIPRRPPVGTVKP